MGHILKEGVLGLLGTCASFLGFGQRLRGAVAPLLRIPALNRSAVDVSGAGDSLLVTAALTLASGGTLHQAALLGSFAAAIQTSRTGNIPIVSVWQTHLES